MRCKSLSKLNEGIMKFFTYKNSTLFWDGILESIDKQRDQKPLFRIATSGGSSAQIFDHLLGKKILDELYIDIYQVDERYVSAKHPDSNQKMLRELLAKNKTLRQGSGSVMKERKNVILENGFSVNSNTSRKNINSASSTQTDRLLNSMTLSDKRSLSLSKGPDDTKISFHTFDTSLSIKKALSKYESKLQIDDDGYLFDLTILGVGPDGHTASLFPHTTALDEAMRLVAHTQTQQFEVQDRLTLTFPAIKRSKQIVILLIGANKKPVWDALQNSTQDFHKFPILKLRDWDNVDMWFLNK